MKPHARQLTDMSVAFISFSGSEHSPLVIGLIYRLRFKILT